MLQFIQIKNQFELSIVLDFLKSLNYHWNTSTNDYSLNTMFFGSDVYYLVINDSHFVADSSDFEIGEKLYTVKELVKGRINVAKKECAQPKPKTYESRIREFNKNMNEINRRLRSDLFDDEEKPKTRKDSKNYRQWRSEERRKW